MYVYSQVTSEKGTVDLYNNVCVSVETLPGYKTWRHSHLEVVYVLLMKPLPPLFRASFLGGSAFLAPENSSIFYLFFFISIFSLQNMLKFAKNLYFLTLLQNIAKTGIFVI